MKFSDQATTVCSTAVPWTAILQKLWLLVFSVLVTSDRQGCHAKRPGPSTQMEATLCMRGVFDIEVACTSQSLSRHLTTLPLSIVDATSHYLQHAVAMVQGPKKWQIPTSGQENA